MPLNWFMRLTTKDFDYVSPAYWSVANVLEHL